MGELLDASARSQPAGRLFTVGIPVFNGKSLLRNCLQSVINSTLPRHRFEIVIADDGSSEAETLAILGEFERSLAEDPGFFRVISLGTNSGGAARPRNRILEEATGEYVFFVDSDDTIGNLALERIADALATTPADWVALNEVPVNGRAAVCEVRHPRAEVPRARALTTLTVHKVFRRAEIERQQLRFDEGLPSGQDLAFAFSYLLNATRFLMLGDYEYYYLTQHIGDLNEPAHLSRRARSPEALIEKNERILRSMLTALRKSDLPESEQREILCRLALPRVLILEAYLQAIVNAGPDAGSQALARLSQLLADPLVADLEPDGRKGLIREHLAVIAKSDWAGLVTLLSAGPPVTGNISRSRRGGVRVRISNALDATLGRQRADWLRMAQRRTRQRLADILAPPVERGRPGGPAKPTAKVPTSSPDTNHRRFGEADDRPGSWIPSDPFVPHPDPTMTRHDLLRGLHDVLAPRTYLEIGVNEGAHLALSRAKSIGVDPDFTVRHPLRCDLDLVRSTSNEFFRRPDALAHFDGVPVDLALIDGTHLSEFAVRDFINVERHLATGGVAVLDDVLPRNALEAARVRRTGAWAGDVYKAVQVIARNRPDLTVVLVNTWPTGTAIVVGGDPFSDALQKVYPSEVPFLEAPDPQSPPPEYLSRSAAVDPADLLASEAWSLLVAARDSGDATLIEEAKGILQSIPTLGELAHRLPARDDAP